MGLGTYRNNPCPHGCTKKDKDGKDTGISIKYKSCYHFEADSHNRVAELNRERKNIAHRKVGLSLI